MIKYFPRGALREYKNIFKKRYKNKIFRQLTNVENKITFTKKNKQKKGKVAKHQPIKKKSVMYMILIIVEYNYI